MAAIIVIFVLIFAYGYMDGVLSSASIVAAAISSRALSARSAFWIAAVSMSLGPFLLGTAVASTIGSQLIAPQAATLPVIGAGLIGAMVWSSFTLWLKLPVSISQSLIGGLMGAAWAGFGGQAIMASGLTKTLLGLFVSPPLGLLVGFLVVKLTYRLSAKATPHINQRFRQAQILLSMLMAVAFSANDSQKIMGVMVLALIANGWLKEFAVPLWVVAFSAGAIGIGALVGSWRLIYTMGGKFYKSARYMVSARSSPPTWCCWARRRWAARSADRRSSPVPLSAQAAPTVCKKFAGAFWAIFWSGGC